MLIGCSFMDRPSQHGLHGAVKAACNRYHTPIDLGRGSAWPASPRTHIVAQLVCNGWEALLALRGLLRGEAAHQARMLVVSRQGLPAADTQAACSTKVLGSIWCSLKLPRARPGQARPAHLTVDL